MFGKFLRLLFMDKAGRENWERRQAAARKVTVTKRRGAQASAQSGAGKPTARAAPAEGGAGTDQAPDSQAVLEAITEAKRLLDVEKEASGDQKGRQDLIHMAMNVHRAKQQSLEELDPKERAQLRVMAEVMMSGKPAKPH